MKTNTSHLSTMSTQDSQASTRRRLKDQLASGKKASPTSPLDAFSSDSEAGSPRASSPRLSPQPAARAPRGAVDSYKFIARKQAFLETKIATLTAQLRLTGGSPPATLAAAKEELALLRQIRDVVGIRVARKLTEDRLLTEPQRPMLVDDCPPHLRHLFSQSEPRDEGKPMRLQGLKALQEKYEAALPPLSAIPVPPIEGNKLKYARAMLIVHKAVERAEWDNIAPTKLAAMFFVK